MAATGVLARAGADGSHVPPDRADKAGKSATVEVKTLRAAMREMVAVVERRNTIPILSYVLLRSGPSTLTLVATDLDVEMRQQIDLASPGKNAGIDICVCAATLAGIMAKLPDGAQATLTLKDGSLLVTAGRSRFTLPTLPPTDFPEVPADDWSARFEMDKANLIALIAATDFAMSTDDTRYYLNGIFFHVRDGQMLGAATDGSRLARFHCEMPDGAEAMGDSIVSRKTVGLIGKLLDAHDGPLVGIDVSARKIRVSIGTVELVAKLVDGTFPDYTRVIPAANDKALWIDPKALAESVDRVSVISSEKARLIRFDLEKDRLVLTVASAESGIAVEEMACSYDAGPLTIGFNAKYVIETLRHLTGDNVQILLSDAAGPTLWRDSEEARRLYVLMPMRV
jgi:DNA polymerase-3 subunit beta